MLDVIFEGPMFPQPRGQTGVRITSSSAGPIHFEWLLTKRF